MELQRLTDITLAFVRSLVLQGEYGDGHPLVMRAVEDAEQRLRDAPTPWYIGRRDGGGFQVHTGQSTPMGLAPLLPEGDRDGLIQLLDSLFRGCGIETLVMLPGLRSSELARAIAVLSAGHRDGVPPEEGDHFQGYLGAAQVHRVAIQGIYPLIDTNRRLPGVVGLRLDIARGVLLALARHGPTETARRTPILRMLTGFLTGDLRNSEDAQALVASLDTTVDGLAARVKREVLQGAVGALPEGTLARAAQACRRIVDSNGGSQALHGRYDEMGIPLLGYFIAGRAMDARLQALAGGEVFVARVPDLPPPILAAGMPQVAGPVPPVDASSPEVSGLFILPPVRGPSSLRAAFVAAVDHEPEGWLEIVSSDEIGPDDTEVEAITASEEGSDVDAGTPINAVVEAVVEAAELGVEAVSDMGDALISAPPIAPQSDDDVGDRPADRSGKRIDISTVVEVIGAPPLPESGGDESDPEVPSLPYESVASDGADGLPGSDMAAIAAIAEDADVADRPEFESPSPAGPAMAPPLPMSTSGGPDTIRDIPVDLILGLEPTQQSRTPPPTPGGGRGRPVPFRPRAMTPATPTGPRPPRTPLAPPPLTQIDGPPPPRVPESNEVEAVLEGQRHGVIPPPIPAAAPGRTYQDTPYGAPAQRAAEPKVAPAAPPRRAPPRTDGLDSRTPDWMRQFDVLGSALMARARQVGDRAVYEGAVRIISHTAVGFLEEGTYEPVVPIARLLRAQEAVADAWPKAQQQVLKTAVDLVMAPDRLIELVNAYPGAPTHERGALQEIIAQYGAPAVPALVRLICGREGTNAIRRELMGIVEGVGAAAGPALVEGIGRFGRRWNQVAPLIRLTGAVRYRPAEPVLSDFLGHPQAGLREETLLALCHMLGRDAETYLLQALDDPQPSVVQRALALLAVVGSRDRRFLDTVHSLITETPEIGAMGEGLAIGAIRVLQDLGNIDLTPDVQAEDVLVDLLRGCLKTGVFGRVGGAKYHRSTGVQVAICDTLGAIGTLRARSTLQLAVREGSPAIRDAAEQALAALESGDH